MAMLSSSGARVLQLQYRLVAWAFGAQQGVCFAGFVLPVKARVPHGRPSLFHGLLHAKHLFLARVRTIAGGELKPWADFSLVGKPMVGIRGDDKDVASVVVTQASNSEMSLAIKSGVLHQ